MTEEPFGIQACGTALAPATFLFSFFEEIPHIACAPPKQQEEMGGNAALIM